MESNREITVENAASVANEILNMDVCHLRVKEDERFAMEIANLKELLYQYRYYEKKGSQVSIQALGTLSQDLLQQVRHCYRYLEKTTRVNK